MKLIIIRYALPFILALIICFTSVSLMMMNTGDYYRAVFPFIENIQQFTMNLPLHYELKGNFSSLTSYEYKSSYSYILYFYAYIVSVFTNIFYVPIYSSLLKMTYILTLAVLFYRVETIKDKRILILSYLISLTPMISSSNLAFFGSFYQEQVLLICLPLLLIGCMTPGWKGIACSFLSITIISCSKSQFFYLPVIILAYYIIYENENIKYKVIASMISLSLSVICILTTTSTVEYNKYHSLFFGVYEYQRLNQEKLPEGIDTDCIGIDAWGNKFNLEAGVIGTSIGESCFQKHKDASFKDTLSVIIKNPFIMLALPFDKGTNTQLTEDYFHVYKAMKLIINNNGFFSQITKTKDYLFKNIRFFALLVILAGAILLRQRRMSGVLFITSSFGVSQFYIAFLGEGYRDMDKHLFGMNFSFDLSLFLLLILAASRIKKHQ